MYVKCPICETRVETEHMEELTEVLRGHMAGMHDVKVPELPLRHEEYCEGGTPEERAVETFSGTDPTKLAEKDRNDLERVTKFQEPRMGETAEEKAVRTFSGMDDEKASAHSKMLKEEVGQFRYPRTGPECERGPGSMPQGGGVVHKMMTREESGFFMDCPLCDQTLRGETEEALSDELKAHYQEHHR